MIEPVRINLDRESSLLFLQQARVITMAKAKANEEQSKAMAATVDTSAETAEPAEPEHVSIRRKGGAEPVTGITYTPFGRLESIAHWHPDPAKTEFEVSADIARAAVDSGGFEVSPTSKVKLKE